MVLMWRTIPSGKTKLRKCWRPRQIRSPKLIDNYKVFLCDLYDICTAFTEFTDFSLHYIINIWNFSLNWTDFYKLVLNTLRVVSDGWLWWGPAVWQTETQDELRGETGISAGSRSTYPEMCNSSQCKCSHNQVEWKNIIIKLPAAIFLISISVMIA